MENTLEIPSSGFCAYLCHIGPIKTKLQFLNKALAQPAYKCKLSIDLNQIIIRFKFKCVLMFSDELRLTCCSFLFCLNLLIKGEIEIR